MRNEQPIASKSTDLQAFHDGSSSATRLGERKPSWISSLILYFAFGVEATLLTTLAQRAAIDSEPILTDPTPLRVEPAAAKPPKHSPASNSREPVSRHECLKTGNNKLIFNKLPH